MTDQIRQNITTLTVTPAAASFATPYSSGDVIGGLNTISKAVQENKSGASLDTLVVLDAANQKSALDIIFLSGIPANSFGADNAAYALNDADLPLVIGRFSVAAVDYVSSGSTNAEATERNVGFLFTSARSLQDIYCIVVSRGTPTYGSATDLGVKMVFRDF